VEGRVEIRGLPEFRRELKVLDGNWPKELRKVHKTIAEEAARRSRGVAARMGGVQAKAATTIKGQSTQKAARISTSGIGHVAYWGAKKHTGWYAGGQYRISTGQQHPDWVGNGWDVATMSGGPYAINPALAMYLPTMLDEYGDMIDDLARRAFPS
jgi:hypothetical protein